ncbi:MAG: anti-sigma factor family protein [Thermomicrobiales bacterium]
MQEGNAVSAVADEMTCQELVELITDYLEHALPAAERARFEAHLASCPGCRTYLDQMRRTLAVVGRLREDDVSPAAREKLLAHFRAWRQK